MMQGMAHINIEIKARCNSQQDIRDILNAQSADFKGVDHQIDTYFKVANGRLKLREGDIENYLIYYEREDVATPKQSSVILAEMKRGSNIKDVLEKSLGVLVVVDKQREIYFIDNVKFHLDMVRGLGTFVEIEAIDRDGSIGREKLLDQCNKYLKLFNISDTDLLRDSYSDQVLNP